MLYYIHGYMSEPDSTKGTLFKEKLGVHPIKYRSCTPEELVVSDCLKKIYEEIKVDSEPILIGSSLGGFFAAKTALEHSFVKHIILLNPATIPPDVDIATISDMPQRILKDMKDELLFSQKIKSRITILVGTLDDVVSNSWPIEFAKSQEATVIFLKDDHSFTRNIEKLPGIIRNILDDKI